MKILTFLTIFILATVCVHGQIDVKEKVKSKSTTRADERLDEGVDKGLDKLEEGVGNLFKKKKKKNTESDEQESQIDKEELNEDNSANPSDSENPQDHDTKKNISYAKYDFTPGNEVIFEDDLKNEQKGEFPSKWDLIEGNAEIAQIDGENTIAIVGFTYITPLFKNRDFKLPDEFTLEFDLYIDNKNGENAIEFLNDNDEIIASSLFWKDNQRFLFSWNMTEKEKSSEDTYNNSEGWHHYALSFNKRAFKVYMDSKRVANIPNVAEKPEKLRFFARGEEDNSNFHIKNIRIAQGAIPLYNRLLTEGKIVTYGITFDIGKATLKPESMGTLNEIFSILTKYPELNFTVEGHTDNTGSATTNQSLSEDRAKAVCQKLQDMGIAANRLKAKGYGMSSPIDSNDTPEGRAKNRRVEFIKTK